MTSESFRLGVAAILVALLVIGAGIYTELLKGVCQ